MKKQIIRHFIQFGAALSLCAAVITVVPSHGTPDPRPGNGKPGITIDDPDADEIPGNTPGISPQSDRPPRRDYEG